MCPICTQYASMPDNFIFIAFYFVLPKRTSPPAFHAAREAHVRGVARTVFLNSLLATLNARQPLRESNSAGGMVSFPLSATTNSRLSFSAGRPQFSQSLTSQDDQVSVRLLVAHGNEGELLTYFYSLPLRFLQRNLQIQVQTTTDTKTDHDHHGVVDEVCSTEMLFKE